VRCLPVDEYPAVIRAPLLYRADECLADSETAARFVHIEILEVANLLRFPSVRVREELNDAYHLAISLRHEALDRVTRIDDASPQQLGSIGRELRLVENEVSLPKGLPSRSIF
jgi:hypothetical protein